MYRTEITLTVLSEEPIAISDVSDICRECDEGDFVLYSQTRVAENIGLEQMAYALLEAGSDPEFFQISTDVDDLKTDWQYEVRNGDTVLGFREWLAHRWQAIQSSLA